MLISGMIIGTAFTLFVVPSIYMLVAKTHAPFRLRTNPILVSASQLRMPLKASMWSVNEK